MDENSLKSVWWEGPGFRLDEFKLAILNKLNQLIGLSLSFNNTEFTIFNTEIREN